MNIKKKKRIIYIHKKTGAKSSRKPRAAVMTVLFYSFGFTGDRTREIPYKTTRLIFLFVFSGSKFQERENPIFPRSRVILYRHF